MSQNSPVNNPKTGTPIFGEIPKIEHRSWSFPGGQILLREGAHRSVNHGFGVEHIWAEHEAEIVRLGYLTKDDVAMFVSDIVISGASLHCEFEDLRGNHKISILHSKLGIAILEQREDGQGEIFYSVITAFTQRKAHGTKIGNVR